MQESEAVCQGVVSFYRALSANDVEHFDDYVSSHPATLVIGTAPGEWVSDRAALRFGFETEGMRLEGGGALVGYAQGGLGWAADDATFIFPDGSRVWCRVTMVLREEDGTWRIVHMHASVGVPDEEVLGLQARWAAASAEG